MMESIEVRFYEILINSITLQLAIEVST